MAYLDEHGIRTDDVQNAADEPESVFLERVTEMVAGYVNDDSDLNDAIINDEATLSAIRALYRQHADDMQILNAARLICMSIDSYLINRATKEIK